jgi:hypothetical protein
MEDQGRTGQLRDVAERPAPLETEPYLGDIN